MDLERIDYRGFKPRGEVDREVRKVAQKILDESNVGGKARLVITDQGGQFHISVVGTYKNRLFSSESSHQKEGIKGWPRTWQLGAIASLLGDFIAQVHTAFRSDKGRGEEVDKNT